MIIFTRGESPLEVTTKVMTHRRTIERTPQRESKRVDFKERLDLSRAEDWCEIIKDIAAMANSGGGSILVGVKDDGAPSGWDPLSILGADPAHFVDKIAKYTGEQFSEFEIVATRRDHRQIAEIRIAAAETPLVLFNRAPTKLLEVSRRRRLVEALSISVTAPRASLRIQGT
jgi:predicted HTH transcriptional regulator